MGTNSNQRKAETLGMPGGTANNRLRKRLIYVLLQMLDEYRKEFGHFKEGFDENGKWYYPAHKWSLYCSVCGRDIQSEDEMTIEHIKPWEGRENGSDLFWDLENIAFSHSWCNRPHETNRKEGPNGTIWCSDCKEFRSVEEFLPSRQDKTATVCRNHHNKRKSEYRERGGVH